jgi:hypothetical protein
MIFMFFHQQINVIRIDWKVTSIPLFSRPFLMIYFKPKYFDYILSDNACLLLISRVFSNERLRLSVVFIIVVVVVIATGYGLDGQSSIPGNGKRFVSTASRLALGPTQSSTNWVPGSKEAEA